MLFHEYEMYIILSLSYFWLMIFLLEPSHLLEFANGANGERVGWACELQKKLSQTLCFFNVSRLCFTP